MIITAPFYQVPHDGGKNPMAGSFILYIILYYIIFLLYLSTIITNHFTRQLEPIN